MLDRLPKKWARFVSRRLAALDTEHRDWFHGNTYLRENVAAYSDNVLPLTATLDDIRRCAAQRAAEALALVERLTDTELILEALKGMCARWRVELPAVERTGGIIARMIDPGWWGRRLRIEHGKATEAQAIRLGLVNARRDKYISEESVRRVEAQNTRNAAITARTYLANEDGEIFALADLIDKSISNKAIRRGELMLRMRGMEEVGEECGCAVDFVVITAPSRFHAVRADGSENEKYDGSTPLDCRDYFQAQWQRCRAWLARRGIDYYGMRTVEAHQDGTAHWNIMVFLRDPSRLKEWRQGVTRYFLLNENPNERGAAQRRLRFERVTKEKGGAAAYIAKYISKNIDGVGLETDLAGDPILTTTRRVEAWTKTWRIRQFQPIGGGARVSVWRELRRINEAATAGAPETFVRAWRAAQRIKGETEELDKRADYAEFIRACGGPWIKRKDARLWLHKEEQEGVGRYGDPLGLRTAGVVVHGEWAIDKGGIVGTINVVVARPVESIRRIWTALKSTVGDFAPAARAQCDDAEIAASRTRVNNCTRGVAADMAELADWVKEYERNDGYGGLQRC